MPVHIFEDGRSFVLSEPKNHYDLVIIFSPEPDNASVNRFCTGEFFRQVNGHLLMGSQSEKMISVDPGILGKRLSLRPDARPFYRFEENGELKKEEIPDEELPAYFSGLFGGILEQRDIFSDSEIETTQSTTFLNRLDASNVKINLDSHPAAVYHSMRVWESITAPGSRDNGKHFLSKIFDFFRERNGLDLTIFPGIFVFFHFYGRTCPWCKSNRQTGEK